MWYTVYGRATRPRPRAPSGQDQDAGRPRLSASVTATHERAALTLLPARTHALDPHSSSANPLENNTGSNVSTSKKHN